MFNDRETTKLRRNMSLSSYRKMKIKMLKDFGVFLGEKETEYIKSLKTEIAIDNFCISMINKRLN